MRLGFDGADHGEGASRGASSEFVVGRRIPLRENDDDNDAPDEHWQCAYKSKVNEEDGIIEIILIERITPIY